jgi:ATP-dependent DNA ligase
VLSLKDRRAILDNVVLRYGLEKTEPFIGERRPLFNAVCRLDLEGIVAKRMDDGYGAGRVV